MKMNLLLMLLVVGLMAGAAQANLLKNPSFEEGIFKPNGTPDFWTHYWTSYAPIHSWISNAAEAHWGSKYIKINLWETGSTAWLMQTVGVTQGQEYVFSVWAKCPDISETSEVWGYYDWLNSADAIISGGWLPWGYDVGGNWTHVVLGELTAPASATQVVYWLAEVPENNFRGILFDDACMSTPLPTFPSPAWEAKVAIGDVVLSWTNMDPDVGDSVWVDVLFGTEPNETHPTYDMAKLTLDPVSGQDVTSAIVEDLTLGTYYWRVDSYLEGNPADVDYSHTDPNLHPIIKGYVWSFDVVSDAPPSSVDASVDMVTWTGEPVALDATVVDDGQSPLTVAWSSDTPVGHTIELSATDIEDPTVMITKVPHAAAEIVNPSFEDWLTGWDSLGGSNWTWNGKWAGKTYLIPTDGNMLVYMDGTLGNPIEGAWLSQTLAETLTVGTTYTLTVDVANDGYYKEDVEYKVQLLAGKSVIAEDDDSHDLDTYGEWETSTIIHTPGADDPNLGQPLVIRLVAKAVTGEMVFDNVQLTADPIFPAPTGVSTVELTLAASDEENPMLVKGTMTIDVYDDACKAAIGADPQATDPGDVNKDCETNFADLREMLLAWLDDATLTEPAVKPKP